MLGKLILPELEDLVAQKQFRQIRDLLRDLDPPDLAELISDVEESVLVVVFRLLTKDKATDVFEYLDFGQQETLLNQLKSQRVSELLEDMSADDRTALLEELPPEAASRLLRLLSPEERQVAQTLLNYPEDSVGRLMTPDIIHLRKGRTVGEALEKIRRIGMDKETVYSLYVIDDRRKLLGFLPLSKLVASPLDVKVDDLMNDHVVSVHTHSDQEEAAEEMRHYDLLALPVVDGEERLVGIITFDDVMDIVEQEFTEDVQLQAAILPDEESYLHVGVGSLFRRRIVWLVVLLLAEMAGVVFLRRYDEALQAAIALAFFLPAMTATGGNTGTQSAALLIRALGTGEVEIKDGLLLLGRDVLVGVLLAGLLGVLAYGLAIAVNGDAAIGLCVGIGLTTIVLLSNIAGTVLPLLFKWLKMDPALMSGPFISTLVDVFGLVIYLEISLKILAGMGA